MASTEYQSGTAYRDGDRNEDQRGYPQGRGRSGPPPGRRGIFIDTEARRGFTTTEFWLTILGVVALVIMAYNSDMLGVRWGMGMATAVLLGYIISRGFAKAGSDEVVHRNQDD